MDKDSKLPAMVMDMHSAFDDEPLANGTMEAGVIYGHVLDQNEPLKYFFVVILIVQSFVGTCGNLLIIGAVFAIDALRHSGNFFIINLAAADLCITAVAQPANVFGTLYGESFFAPRYAYCATVSTLCAVGCLSSCWNMMMIAVNRYFLICKFPYYEKIYTKFNTAMMCVLCWVIIYSVELPNHFGWGDLRYSNVFYLCTFANHVHSYALFYTFVGVLTPLIIAFVMYLHIYLRVRNSKMTRNMILNGASSQGQTASAGASSGTKVIPSATNQDADSVAEQTRLASINQKFVEDLKIIYALFRVYIIFILMWLPLVLIIMIGQPNGEPFHHGWYIATLIVAHGNSSINCFIYAATIDHFRVGYLKLLGCSNRKPGSRAEKPVPKSGSVKRLKPAPEHTGSAATGSTNMRLLSMESSSQMEPEGSSCIKTSGTELVTLNTSFVSEDSEKIKLH